MRSRRVPQPFLAAGFIGIQVALGLLSAGGASAGVGTAANGGASRPPRVQPSVKLLQRVTVRSGRATVRNPLFVRVNLSVERGPTRPEKPAKLQAGVICRP